MTKRFTRTILTLGIAAGGLLVSTNSAHAGNKEAAVIQSALATAGLNYETATRADWQNIIGGAIAANPKMKPGVLAGEALKRATGTEAGSGIADGLVGAVLDPKKINIAIADAAVTASTSTAANAVNVPEFSSVAVTTREQVENVSKLAVKKSATAAGALIGGFAINPPVVGAETPNDARARLVNEFFINEGGTAKKAASAIAQYVGAAIEESGTTTESDLVLFNRAISVANIKFVTKLVPGSVAADPLQAGALVEDSLNNSGTAAAAIKGVKVIAKAVALVADVEEVQKVGAAIGLGIGSGAISLKNVNAVAKTLVQGIVKHPVLDPLDPATTTINKIDEIGEVGAYLLNGIIANGAFDVVKKNKPQGAQIIIGMLKNLVAGAKEKGSTTIQNAVAIDLAGSIGLTLNSIFAQTGSTIDATTADLIKGVLTNPATAKKVLGKKLAKTLATAFTTAITDGLNNANSADTKFEDGTQPLLGTVNEPVTDNRNG